jgi:hypothetical protein
MSKEAMKKLPKVAHHQRKAVAFNKAVAPIDSKS